jgi:two-component system copper resistance phosphate regulon response regulator CusR
MDRGAANAGSRRVEYDLMVCDLGRGKSRMPEISGADTEAPVLFLADRQPLDRREAESGHDFLFKPFAFTDFLARVRGMLRAGSASNPMILRIAGLELDLVRHRAERDGRRLDLTPKEFLLLSLLMRKAGEVLSRTYIADQVWEINFESNTNFVDVHIRRLRSKVDDPFPRKLIQTVRGCGYVFEER